ncbi:MAG: 5,10-methylenetetrahydrofolate reductase, partial [Flavitalea sp.]
MFAQKIKNRESGIVVYGITPPKSETTSFQMASIAEKTINRLIPLDLDALIVYDVQDESARTAKDRPFPFLSAHDPLMYASRYLNDLDVPKIIYRPAGKFTPAELSEWLSKLDQHRFHPVFVGVPSPDFPVKTSLPEAYKIFIDQQNESVLGAVTIPERHAQLKDEQQRILDKSDAGVSYFISQCIFNLEFAKQLIDDLFVVFDRGQAPTIIFTLTACGSPKTLGFLDWLGIHVPEHLSAELLASENMLQRSVEVCLEIANALTEHCLLRGIAFGFNIESVAIRKDEIEASVFMVKEVTHLLEEKGLRKKFKDPALK